MNKIYLRAFWLLVLIALPFLANAAGLGKLTLGSSLGQPLRAEIDLVSVKEDEVSSLIARVASPEAFRQAGVALAPYHSSLVISVEKRANGQPYIQITSPQSINEPFLNLLIELNWSSGRLLREYTVLLDPVDNKVAEPASPIVAPVTETASQSAATPKTAVQSNQSGQKSKQPSKIKPSIPGSDTYGPVVKGDTLTRIARQVTPDGVDLNQMLVALYRANRSAFFEKNMNLLKVGTILRIPDQNEISAITRKEANREVKTQIADWRNYRERVATAGTASTTQPAQRQELKQAATGKITTTVEEPKLKKEDAPTEVLILSKGEGLGDGKNSIGKPDSQTSGASQDYVRMMEEDAIAKDRALTEANERVTMLEQNIERLQRLLEIKNTGMADIQKQAEQAQTIAEPLTQLKDEREIVSDKPADDLITPQELAKTEELGSQPDSANAPNIPTPSILQNTPIPTPLPSEPETDFVEQIMAIVSALVDFTTENIEIVGGALITLLTGWLGISYVRRKKAQAINTDEDEINFDEEKASSPLSSTAVPEAAIDQFETKTEASLSNESNEADSSTNNSQNSLSQAASGFFFGKNTDERFTPDHTNDTDPQQFDSGLENTRTIEPAQEFKFDMREANQLSSQPEETINQKDATSHQDFILDFSSNQSQSAQTASTSHDMDFHIDLPEDTNKTSSGFSGKLEDNEPIVQSFDDQLTKLNLTDIKLDLEEDTTQSEKAISHSESVTSEWQEEVATKIDLAKAYLEMDDKEGAKEILEEVLREGSDEQQAFARTILNDINANA
ncbi:MAG: hypothetical protein IPI97_01190 [Nitrosomonas sp.]|nr:hypothetical protein [Nitrosomonas sp.]